MTRKENPAEPAVPQDAQRYVQWGYWIVIAGLFGLILWAALAPLDKGVAATGSVIVAGHRKTVQAPDNGKVEQVLIKEGDKVVAGQLLIQLEQTHSAARLTALREKYLTMQAIEERLQAEKRGNNEITFSPRLTVTKGVAHGDVLLESQRQLFYSRRQALNNEIQSYQQQSHGLLAEYTAIKQALKNKRLQLSVLGEQTQNMQSLAEQGYLSRNRLLDTQRQLAEVKSSTAEMSGRLSQLEKQRQEMLQRIVLRQAEYRQEVDSQLAQTQLDLADISSQITQVEQEHRNTSVFAPVAGRVVEQGVFTPGSVVRVGEKLLDVVPEDNGLVVEARLRTDLADKVSEGLPVSLLFVSFNQSTTPRVPGVVKLVSADSLTDRYSGETYYRLEVAVTQEGINGAPGDKLKPGMPVELFIKTGSRTLLNYLFKPLIDRAFSALSEE
ncbi:HlyD family type I secretion periplasmic adaptor subunit [Paramixta manurensis]|uniref:Membrane fusion protein (MFP) family protein n=1 Tax=Paramixta manurensis TaxID=2740817 RepID=A0A6M8UUJ6_9GAMM|nr:HlyD family type I secretion periplasmic adaptor subunit [Erwiniaceae bacterium PD-1]